MSTHQNKHGEKVNMEISKLNFVRDGAIRLPPGFRFQPTDQEIVFQYLIRKVFSCPLPASIVPETVNICKFNPWDLPGDWEQDRYFFSKNEGKYGIGHVSNRASEVGYWKATGFNKQITRCCNNGLNSNSRKQEIITGMKKTFVFYKGKAMHGELTTRTYWIMHEYRLVHSPYSPKTTSNDKRSWIQLGNWVLCHIFSNKRSRNVGVADRKTISRGLTPQAELLHHGFNMRNDGLNVKDEPSSSSSSSSSSCGSSVVTDEVSSDRKLLHHDS